MKTQTTAPAIGRTSRGRLRAARHFLLPGGLLLGFAALAPTSNAQANLIRIRNIGKEFVKVCVYEEHDRVQLIPLRCWDLSASETATWNRNDNSQFHVQLFIPVAMHPDLPLCQRNNVRADVEGIDVAKKPCTIAAVPKKTLTVLQLCNETNDKIYGAFAYWEGDETGWTSLGWYAVESAKCRDVDVGNYVGDIYYYATDNDSVFWSGDVRFCVHWTENFSIHKSDESRCQAAGQRRVGMTKLTVKPGINTRTFAP